MATMETDMNIEHFIKHQRWYKWSAITVALVIVATINATTKIMDGYRLRNEPPFALWEPFAW